VLKTAEGERVTVKPAEIESRKVSEVSLMPEGLAQTMSEDDLVDLITFLHGLRRPVSIVGRYLALRPASEPDGASAFGQRRVDPSAPGRDADGKDLAWRRLDADAEGRLDLATLVGTDASRPVYVFIPIVSPVEQEARLVVDTAADVRAWLDGRLLDLSGPG